MLLGKHAPDSATRQPIPAVAKAKVEFERAQRVEERFHKDFDGVDFTDR
jgi:hypothetical protein